MEGNTNLCSILESPSSTSQELFTSLLTAVNSDKFNEDCAKIVLRTLPAEVVEGYTNTVNVANIFRVLAGCADLAPNSPFDPMLHVVTHRLFNSIRQEKKLTFEEIRDTARCVLHYGPKEDAKEMTELLKFCCKYVNSKDAEKEMDAEKMLELFFEALQRVLTLSSECDVDVKLWPIGVLGFVRKLLMHSPGKMTDRLRYLLWTLIFSVVKLYGYKWFGLDVEFSVLLANLNKVELQMILHDPSKIDHQRLAIHSYIVEILSFFVDGEDEFDEDPHSPRARQYCDIALAVGESIKYVTGFWTKAAEEKEDLRKEVTTELLNFCLNVLRYDQVEIVEKSTLEKMGPLMVEKLEQLVVDPLEPTGDVLLSARDFVESLDILPRLSDRLPIVVVELVVRLYKEDNVVWKEVALEAMVVFNRMKKQKDWWSAETVQDACSRLRSLPTDSLKNLDALLVEVVEINQN